MRDAAGNQGLVRTDLRFGTSLLGDIYITTKQDGYVRKLTPRPRCGDGVDNDGDGSADFPADISCRFANSLLERTECSDGIDNDSDAAIDWDGGGVGPPDPQCSGDAWRNRESAQRGCGLGFEIGAVLLPIAWAFRRRQPAARSSRSRFR